MYRVKGKGMEVLLAHPGGPYWSRKDEGAWTIPKGEPAPNEELLAAAIREFGEETGFQASPPFIPLGSIRQRSGKTVYAWAAEGDCRPEEMKSNSFSLEWPPKSGRKQEFPEVDRVAWLSIDEARARLKPEQFAFVERLETLLAGNASGSGFSFYGEKRNLKGEDVASPDSSLTAEPNSHLDKEKGFSP